MTFFAELHADYGTDERENTECLPENKYNERIVHVVLLFFLIQELI